ncbi:16608_t:CDS:2, partial [Gigaspora margarita]
LSQYAPEILELLTNDKEKRHQARNCLLNGYKFSKEQVFALIPLQRVGRYKSQVPVPERSGLEAEEETIKEMAQRIVRDKLSERDIKAISRTLVETAPDPVVALSHLSRLRRELRTLNVQETIISATLNPEITRSSNKIQKERSEKRKNEGIDFSDHFLLESVKERLDLYDVSNTSDKQALADIMIMLCIQPAKIKNLRITNGGVTGYAKNWGQQDIHHVFRSLEKNKERAKKLLTWIQKAIVSGQLRDPEKLGSTYLSTFLKKDEFIPKPYKPLLPSSLRKLGSVFASVVHSAKNLSEANTFASKALKHSPENHASPSDRYTIVNFRRSSLRKLGAVFASVAHGPKNASKANTYASEAL